MSVFTICSGRATVGLSNATKMKTVQPTVSHWTAAVMKVGTAEDTRNRKVF